MNLWRVIRREFSSVPLSADGARAWPGRWHSTGTAVLYTASTESLATLESFIHVTMEYRTLPFVQLRIEIPDDAAIDEFERLIPAIHELPDWRGEDTRATRALGDAWAKDPGAGLALSVPSLLSASERNLLLRPGSPDFARVKVVDMREFVFDRRMWKSV